MRSCRALPWKCLSSPSTRDCTTRSTYVFPSESELTYQLFPILISLEAGADRQIAEQALALHTTLHTKHPSLLNVRYLEFARSSFDYLRSITAEPVGHYNGTPGLGGWYDLLSEKRAWRLEFLRALVKAFDFELIGNEKVRFPFAGPH